MRPTPLGFFEYWWIRSIWGVIAFLFSSEMGILKQWWQNMFKTESKELGFDAIANNTWGTGSANSMWPK
jgi:hypothetical protein